jgi:hypothetical protein
MPGSRVGPVQQQAPIASAVTVIIDDTIRMPARTIAITTLLKSNLLGKAMGIWGNSKLLTRSVKLA